MDLPRTNLPAPALHPALRHALQALFTAVAMTMATAFAVTWVLRTFGYTSELQEVLVEAQRWFLPMFLYLWGMFWMIDAAQRPA